MNFKLQNARYALVILAAGVVLAGCQKMDRPALATDYPKDTNPPGGPLKFYAAYDGGNVDSTRANFGVSNNVTFVDGISGKAMSAGANGYIVYPSANDFKNSTSFTVSFWMKKNGPNPAGGGTSFAFGIATTTDIWTSMDMFFMFEDAGNPSSKDSAAAKFYVNDQWFEFVKEKRIPKLLDGNWHHVAFVFDGTASKLIPYVDGAPVANLPADFGKFNNNGGKLNFAKMAGVVVGGPGHFAVGKTPDGWMGNFNGAIDQFRLYGTALSAADVTNLYTAKM
ncbi:MAG: LamG domain-containing protein [Bacteroidota bacterium]